MYRFGLLIPLAVVGGFWLTLAEPVHAGYLSLSNVDHSALLSLDEDSFSATHASMHVAPDPEEPTPLDTGTLRMSFLNRLALLVGSAMDTPTTSNDAMLNVNSSGGNAPAQFAVLLVSVWMATGLRDYLLGEARLNLPVPSLDGVFRPPKRYTPPMQ